MKAERYLRNWGEGGDYSKDIYGGYLITLEFFLQVYFQKY